MIKWRRSWTFLKDQIEKTRRNPSRVPIIIAKYGLATYRRIFAASPRIHKASKSPADISLTTGSPPAPSGAARRPNPFISGDLPPEVVELSDQYKARRITHFLIGRKNIDRQNSTVARSVASFFDKTDSLKGATFELIQSQVSEFHDIYLNAPVTMNRYGVHFSTGLFLFLIARRRDPALMVESGVYKGLSTYFLSAACPAAELHAFDPNLSELVYRSANATYRPVDWMEYDIRCDPLRSNLAFFDDHQSQARRVIEAYGRGFRHLIFDDSWPIEAVIGCGWPPIPSIDMLMNDALDSNESVRWVEEGKIWTYIHDEEMRRLCAKARALISGAYEVPSLYRETGIAPTSALKYVELVR